MSGEPRIVLADDHAATRLGVRLALQEHGFRIVAEAADGPGAVEAAFAHRPEICLLDIYMPGGGIAAAAELGERLPETAVVMLSVSEADEDLFEALRVGARGYLLKDTPPQRLPHALRAVLDGEAPLPRALTARLISEFQRRGGRRHARTAAGGVVRLSGREAEILELLRDGHGTAETAKRLAISPVTVRRHISEIVRKLQVEDRAAALRLTGDGSA